MLLASCVFILLALSTAEGESESPPNVLFIAVDDLRPDLGCYGVEDAQTPALDEFSKRASLFANHFVQVPTCGASRYSLLTGRSPVESRALGNGAFTGGKNELKATGVLGAQTFPELFRQHGYFTVCIGKISHTPDGRVFGYRGKGDGRHEIPLAWDRLATPFGPWKRGWGTFFAYAGGRHREDGKGNRDLMEFVVDEDNELPDGLMAEAAISTLRELKGSTSPFFLGLGFFKPHLPFVAPRGDWEAFDESSLSSPKYPEKSESRFWHRSGEFFQYKSPFDRSKPLSPNEARHVRRGYLASVRYVDRQIGRVLNSLEELELDKNTIVVVWGDHGWHLGESGIWGKHTPLERALRSVCMIRRPGQTKGQEIETLISSLDLYPTLKELADLNQHPIAHSLDGTSLVPLLDEKQASVRRLVASYWQSAISLRSESYRVVGDYEYHQDEDRLQLKEPLELYDAESSWDVGSQVSVDHPKVKEVEAWWASRHTSR